MSPRISIITINRNNDKGLKKTIESVIQQTYKNIEFIIVDGASSDNSVEIIKSYANSLSWWVSEPDSGIYNAMNKGLDKAGGEYLLFLNSGDYLENDSILQQVAPFLDGTDIVYGDLIIAETGRQWVKKYNSKLTFGYFFYDTLPHQAAFINRNIITRVGSYDESLKVCADWKFFIDAVCRYNATLGYVNKIITVYDYTGVSSDPQNLDWVNKEKYQVFEQHYQRYLPDYLELDELRKKYPPLANSRAIKIYLKLRSAVLGIVRRK